MTEITYGIAGFGDGSAEIKVDNLRGVMTFTLGEDGPCHQFEYQIEPHGLNGESIISFFCKHNPRLKDADRVKLFHIVGRTSPFFPNQVVFDMTKSVLKDKTDNDSLPVGGNYFYNLIAEGKKIDDFVLNVEMVRDDRIAGGRRKKKSRKKKSHKKKSHKKKSHKKKSHKKKSHKKKSIRQRRKSRRKKNRKKRTRLKKIDQ